MKNIIKQDGFLQQSIDLLLKKRINGNLYMDKNIIEQIYIKAINEVIDYFNKNGDILFINSKEITRFITYVTEDCSSFIYLNDLTINDHIYKDIINDDYEKNKNKKIYLAAIQDVIDLILSEGYIQINNNIIKNFYIGRYQVNNYVSNATGSDTLQKITG